MSYMKPISLLITHSSLLAPLACLALIAGNHATQAAAIGIGNVTTTLRPSFFVDEAATGGTDTILTQPLTGPAGTYNRSFAGLLNTNQGPTPITLTGFGFAANGSPANNTATTLTVSFTYLGADEEAGGGDDVLIGSAAGNYNYGSIAAAGEYVFTFDTPLTATLNITGVRFQIQVFPTNSTSNGRITFKNAALNYEAAVGPKFSVAGSAPSSRLNLAKYQPGTTSSVNGQQLATYLTDGVVGNDNRWQSSGAAPHWAQVTFPYPVQVGSAQVFSGVDDISAMTNFKLQYLDNSVWVDVPGASVSENSNVERNLLFTSPVTASAFRIYNSVDATIHVKELAFYPPNGAGGYPIGTDLTLNLAAKRTALATTANTTGNFAMLAVDGWVNKNSKWQTSVVGSNTLEIDLRVNSKIGSAHLYSGLPGTLPLDTFVLRYWDGAAWQDIPGSSVTGNTSAARVIPFTNSVTTSKVQLVFTNAVTTSVQELCIFPANNNGGYPIGTGVTGALASTAKFDDYNDTYYRITNPTANRFVTVNNHLPGLGQTGATTAQGQYQVLLNIGAGTYRLYNRATGNCLSGAQLANTPGALLVDAPYSALPDQDWILQPVDATNFYLINQWSGLALDTQGGGTAAGTRLAQNISTGAASQRWQFVSSARSPKKGIGGSNFATTFKANWVYNWGLGLGSTTVPSESMYHPMQWGNFNWDGSNSNNSTWKLYSTWRTTGRGLHLLGYNEPNKTEQANMTVADGVALWPRLQAMDLPLVAPCPANLTGGWMDSFYTQATALGYRMDYMPKHTYGSPGGGSSDDLISGLQSAYTTWDLPMWLTEFSFVDWGGTAAWSEEDNYNALAEFLWRAESVTWLRKYALFVFTADAANPMAPEPWSVVTPAPRSNARDTNGDLTPFGELYAAWDNSAAVGTNKPYFIHNKGTRKRVTNTLTTTPNGASIRVNDSSTQWTLVLSPTANQYYIVSSRDGRRLSYVNAGAVNFVAAGTTGTAVQWRLVEKEYGWFYLEHPATSRRLQLGYNNTTSVATYTMAAITTITDAVQWRFIVPLTPPIWTGVNSASWDTAENWVPKNIPTSFDAVIFDSSSTANLATVLNQDFDIAGLTLTTPSGPVSIGGTSSLTLRGIGIDLSGATRNLTIDAPLVVGASQNWDIASGRTLSINGVVSGGSTITVTGAGNVSLGAASLLPNGANAVSLVVNGTLDLNGFPQSVNGLSGSGSVNGAGGGTSILTVGNNNAASTFGGILQNTSGTLALVKIGSGGITLSGINTHSGGFINHGAGNVTPQNNAAFGSGPVVMNAATIYSTSANYTFSNALTLNGASLRTGGSNSRTLTWSGPVSVTADSALLADGGTTGVTLSGGLNMNNGGHTLTSVANGGAHTISDAITGSNGTIMVTNGTLNLNAPNPFGGTFRSAAGGPLRIGHADAMQNATLDMNSADAGSVNLNNLSATLGALTGSRNLALGSGAVSIGNNHLNTTYSGVLSGIGSLTKTGNGTLTLSNTNTYNGTTTVNAGTLTFGANNVIPSTAVSIGNATLNAATFTETAGTLDVTSTAKINLGSGATLAFANSSAVNWSGGTLSITGTFVPGISLRFGTGNAGLTATQLGLISVTGFSSLSLNSSGFLITTENYMSWATANNVTGGPDGDSDNDGVKNLIEYALVNDGERGVFSGNTLTFTKRGAPYGSDVSYTIETSETLVGGSWSPAVTQAPGDPSATISYTFTPGTPVMQFARLRITF